MIRGLRPRRGRLFALPVILLVGALSSAIWWGPTLTAWAADPTVRYISHRFPMLELWAKKMGEYPGIKFEAELIPFDQALEKMQIHLSQGAPTYDIMATDAFLGDLRGARVAHAARPDDRQVPPGGRVGRHRPHPGP